MISPPRLQSFERVALHTRSQRPGGWSVRPGCWIPRELTEMEPERHG